MKKSLILFCLGLVSLSLLLGFAKSPVASKTPNQKGKIRFGVASGSNMSTTQKLQPLSTSDNTVPACLLLELTDGNGTKFVDNALFPLIASGGSYLTDPIDLPVGKYKITKYVITDAQKNSLDAAPMSGSSKAKLVAVSLPIDFQVGKDSIKTMTPEVVAVNGEDPQTFGYVGFKLNPVAENRILISVFVKNPENNQLELSPGYLTLSGPTGYLEVNLQEKVNEVLLKTIDPNAQYALHVFCTYGGAVPFLADAPFSAPFTSLYLTGVELINAKKNPLKFVFDKPQKRGEK